MRKYFSSFVKSIFKKEFWKFTFQSEKKKWILLFTVLFDFLAIALILQNPIYLFWSITGLIFFNVLNLAQLHDTYYKTR